MNRCALQWLSKNNPQGHTMEYRPCLPVLQPAQREPTRADRSASHQSKIIRPQLQSDTSYVLLLCLIFATVVTIPWDNRSCRGRFYWTEQRQLGWNIWRTENISRWNEITLKLPFNFCFTWKKITKYRSITHLFCRSRRERKWSYLLVLSCLLTFWCILELDQKRNWKNTE